MTDKYEPGVVKVSTDGLVFAHEIVVTQRIANGGHHTFTIDGQPFPWHILGSVSTEIRADDVPAITITIPADRLSILNTIYSEEEDVD